MKVCATCGSNWTQKEADESAPAGYYHFSTASNPKGTYLSVQQVLDSVEELLTCPRDPLPIDKVIKGPGSRYKPEKRKIPSD
jgi:hypothetical protein